MKESVLHNIWKILAFECDILGSLMKMGDGISRRLGTKLRNASALVVHKVSSPYICRGVEKKGANISIP